MKGDGNREKQNQATESAWANAYSVKDPELFARNLTRAIEEAGKVAAAWTRPPENGSPPEAATEPAVEMVKVLSRLTEYWLGDPSRALEAQTRLFARYLSVWTNSIGVLTGGQAAGEGIQPEERDKRFADPDWTDHPFFDFLKQVYLVTARWAAELVENTEGLDEETLRKARFYVRQLTEALSPTNFLLTNPQVLRETLASDGENLVRGMQMLAEDVAAGKGELRLRQTDDAKFELGRNIAATPGKVVARGDLAEIIQYQPTTAEVLRRPLLIVPPWINKYYVLDLGPERSFIRWAVDQGHTVFVISWVNPDERHADKGWEAYIREGIEFGLDAIEARTGEQTVNAVGYCVGGTLLASALALMAQEEDRRIAAATFLAAQVDFTHAGELKVFADADQVAALEKAMEAKGYLEGTRTAMAFNMLRARELIWPYVVNNYLRGRQPLPFDLLYWNSDATRLTAANHSQYLRECYLENNLAEGRAVVRGRRLSLADIDIPVYNVAAKDDHIAPAKSVFAGCRLFGGPTEFVLAGSGHIAGVVNAPKLGKYQYWTGQEMTESLDDWLMKARPSSGSWWPHWHSWLEKQDDTRTPARAFDRGEKLLGEAPGEYVRVRI